MGGAEGVREEDTEGRRRKGGEVRAVGGRRKGRGKGEGRRGGDEGSKELMGKRFKKKRKRRRRKDGIEKEEEERGESEAP